MTNDNQFIFVIHHDMNKFFEDSEGNIYTGGDITDPIAVEKQETVSTRKTVLTNVIMIKLQ